MKTYYRVNVHLSCSPSLAPSDSNHMVAVFELQQTTTEILNVLPTRTFRDANCRKRELCPLTRDYSFDNGNRKCNASKLGVAALMIANLGHTTSEPPI